MQWMQWNSGIWWGHCLWCKKVTPVDVVRNGCTMQWNSGIWWWGHCLWCKKVKPVDAVCNGCTMQWNSGIWWWGHCLWCKKVKPVNSVTQWTQYIVDTVRSGIVLYGGGDIVFDTKRSNQWTHGMQYNSGIWWWGHCL